MEDLRADLKLKQGLLYISIILLFREIFFSGITLCSNDDITDCRLHYLNFIDAKIKKQIVVDFTNDQSVMSLFF